MLDRENFIALIPKLRFDEQRHRKLDKFLDEEYHGYLEFEPNTTWETAYHICGGDDLPNDFVDSIFDMIFWDDEMTPEEIYEEIQNAIKS